jgi:hypothetical protein
MYKFLLNYLLVTISFFLLSCSSFKIESEKQSKESLKYIKDAKSYYTTADIDGDFVALPLSSWNSNILSYKTKNLTNDLSKYEFQPLLEERITRMEGGNELDIKFTGNCKGVSMKNKCVKSQIAKLGKLNLSNNNMRIKLQEACKEDVKQNCTVTANFAKEKFKANNFNILETKIYKKIGDEKLITPKTIFNAIIKYHYLDKKCPGGSFPLYNIYYNETYKIHYGLLKSVCNSVKKPSKSNQNNAVFKFRIFVPIKNHLFVISYYSRENRKNSYYKRRIFALGDLMDALMVKNFHICNKNDLSDLCQNIVKNKIDSVSNLNKNLGDE